MAIAGKVGAVYVQTSAAPVAFTDEATNHYGNLLTKNQSNVETDLTGFETREAGVTMARDTTEKYQGSASLNIVTPGGIINEGISTNTINVAPSKTYTFSAFVKGTGTVRLSILEHSSAGSYLRATSSINFSLTSSWQRFSVTATVGSDCEKIKLQITTNPIQATTFFVDCWQFEIGSTPISWIEGTGLTKFRISDNAKKYFDKNAVVTVKKNSVIQTSGFKVDNVGGVITFDTPLASTDIVTVSGNYLTVAQSGGFFNWSLDAGADTSEVTIFQSNGWKEHQATLKEWSASAEAYWGNSDFFDKLGTDCVVVLYLDTSANLRFEGYGIITGDGIEVNVEDVIPESIDIQGNGILYLREG